MAKEGNQKLKILYLMKILLEKTDETHNIKMADIISSLAAYGISAERKSIYNDIETLRQYGMDIIGEPIDRTFAYHVGSRQFELAELKLLVDSVQSSKFITEKKTRELIKKIEGLASKYEASQLQRQVYVTDRNKTVNEHIYYNVDMIHAAINANRQISFQYFQWDINKKMVLKKDGERYLVSPWALSWDDENYYLIAYDNNAGIIKHFRVDKMLKIDIESERRLGEAHFKQFDMAKYAKKMFGMFAGEEQVVKLECVNSFAGIIIDRFGQDVNLIKKNDEHFVVNVHVAVSRQFLAWVISLGDGIRIIGPDVVVEQMKTEVNRLMYQYLNTN